jgi:hypothetical protein
MVYPKVGCVRVDQIRSLKALGQIRSGVGLWMQTSAHYRLPLLRFPSRVWCLCVLGFWLVFSGVDSHTSRFKSLRWCLVAIFVVVIPELFPPVMFAPEISMCMVPCTDRSLHVSIVPHLMVDRSSHALGLQGNGRLCPPMIVGVSLSCIMVKDKVMASGFVWHWITSD